MSDLMDTIINSNWDRIMRFTEIIKKNEQELAELRAWKEKARPFLKEYLDDNYRSYNDIAKASRHQQLTELIKGEK